MYDMPALLSEDGYYVVCMAWMDGLLALITSA